MDADRGAGTARLWRTEEGRYFVIPADVELPPGTMTMSTWRGSEVMVDGASAAPFEVTAEEAQAWTKEQLAQTLRELRGNALESVQRLRAGTEKLREENRRTWEEGVANAPPELRDAAELMRTRLRDLAQVLKRAAREHGAGAPPPPADTSPPDEP